MLQRLYGRPQHIGTPPASWFSGRNGPYAASPPAELPWNLPGILDYWDARYGVTSASERVSAWAPSLKGSHSLDQATAANQPILLPYSGTNYLWLPGVGGNYASAPDSVPLSITGDIDLRAKVSANNWSDPGQVGGVIAKYVTAGQQSYVLRLVSNTLRLIWSADGSNDIFKDSTTTLPFSNFASGWVRATLDVDNGAVGNDVKFYTSSNYDPDTGTGTWTQLGTTVTTAGTTSIFNSTAILQVGDIDTGGTQFPFAGKAYRAQIYNGIDGTKVFDANFTAVPEGATSFTESSSNAATVTINSTGSKPAQVVGSQQILFDGVAHFLQSIFTLNQPATVVLVGEPRTYTAGDSLYDGGAATATAYQWNTGSNIQFNAGADISNVAFPLNAYGVLSTVANGASSRLQIGLGTPVTGNAGANNPGGLTLGATFGGANFGNFQAKSVAVANSALSQARLNQLIRAMAYQASMNL